MQQLEILHKRNLLIYYSLLVTITIYLITMGIGFFDYHYQFPLVSLFLMSFLGLLFYLKVKPNKLKWLLILSCNIIAVLLVIQCTHILSLFWFIYFLVLVSVYRLTIVNILLAFFTTIEVFVVVKGHFQHVLFEDNMLLPSYFFFLILLCFIGLLQTIYLRKLWGRVEKKNMDKELELTKTEAYLNLFFNYAEDAIAVFDLENKIIEVNPAFEKLYGWTREECIGKKLELVPPQNKDSMLDRMNRLLQGERIHLLETQDMRKDGTLFDAQLSLAPIYNTYGEVIAVSVISRDVSYIKENERLILQSEKLKLAGEIAAGVAHEVRNPMTVISGFAQLINEDKNSPYHPYTDIIKSEIDRIDLIISEFLVLSRPAVDMQEMIDLQNILQDINTLFQLEFKNKNIVFETNVNVEETRMLGNRNQIKQVMINIIKNSMEAIVEKGTITASIHEDKQNIYFDVTDNGKGMPDHLVKRIFEPFFTTKTTGTGLGMMITNKIVQEHNGDIKIYSKENKGTKIEIRFPKVTDTTV